MPPRSRHRFAVLRLTLCGALACALLAGSLGCAGSIEDRLAEVRALQDAGQFSESVEPLREILARNPDLAEANYLLGVALVQTGQPSLAVFPLEKASENEQHAVQAGLLLASTFMTLEAHGDAVRTVDRVIEIDPERVAAIKIRAQALLGANDREAALEDTERLRELAPDDFHSLLMHATILAELDRIEEAEEAHRELEEIAAKSGDTSLAARGCLARASFIEDNVKDDERAEQHFRRCLELNPTEPLALQLATRFFDERGRRDEATAIWRQAVEEVPENLGFRLSLASRYEAAGDVDEARALITEAVDLLGTTQAWHQLAELERRAGDPDAALAAVEQAVAAAPGRAEQLEFLRADLLVDLERLDEASEVAETLTEPSFRDLMRGRIQLANGDAEGALAAFDAGLRRWPNNAGGRYLAGLAARELGQFERAKSEFRESLRVDPRATDSALVLASLHLAQGEHQQAADFARRFVTNRGGGRADGYQVYVLAAIRLGQYEAARGTVEAMVEAGFDAEAATAAGQIAEAESGAQAAVDAIRETGIDLTDPANEVPFRLLVENLIELGQAEEAIALTDRAIAAHPDASTFHDLRGALLVRAEREDEARAAFERALELDAGNGRAKAGLAELAMRAGDVPAAIALYDEAAALSEDDSRAAFAAAQLVLASGDVAGARQRLERIVRDDAAHAGARNDLAWLLAEAGEDLDRALQLAQVASRIDPSPEILDTLGWVRLKRGEIDAAVGLFERALEQRPESQSLQYHLGLALAEQGEADRALDVLKTAIDGGPFPEADAARSEIAKLERR